MTTTPSLVARTGRLIPAVFVALMSFACSEVLSVDDSAICSQDARKVGRVTVMPASLTLKVADSAHVNARVFDTRGQSTFCMEPATWASSDTTVATVRWGIGLTFIEPPLVRARRPGAVYVKATSTDVSDSLLVTVISGPP